MLLSNLVVSYGTTGGSKQALLSNLVVPPGTTGSREATVYIGIVHRGGFFEVSTQYDTKCTYMLEKQRRTAKVDLWSLRSH